MLLATFCNQAHSYLTQHPAAPFPNQIMQNTQMCYCVSWGYGEISPGKLWNPALARNIFTCTRFLLLNNTADVLKARPHGAPPLCRNRFLNCQLVILSSWVCRMPHMLFLLSTWVDDPHSHKNENTLGPVDADRWAGVGLARAHTKKQRHAFTSSLVGLMQKFPTYRQPLV